MKPPSLALRRMPYSSCHMGGRLRIAAALLALLTLSSCSYFHIVRAAMIDGALVFVAAGANNSYPCWGDFTVFGESGRPVWAFDRQARFELREECPPKFPLLYGREPDGAERLAGPERLMPGRLYVIEGYFGDGLGGAFIIRSTEGRLSIENIAINAPEVQRAKGNHHDFGRDLPSLETATLSAGAHAVPHDNVTGAASDGKYMWLVNVPTRTLLPSLAYGTIDERRIRIEMGCRWPGTILVRLHRPVPLASRLTLESGGRRLTIPLRTTRGSDRDFPGGYYLSAAVPATAQVMATFADTGRLTMGLDGEMDSVDAIRAVERDRVRRFYQRCA